MRIFRYPPTFNFLLVITILTDFMFVVKSSLVILSGVYVVSGVGIIHVVSSEKFCIYF